MTHCCADFGRRAMVAAADTERRSRKDPIEVGAKGQFRQGRPLRSRRIGQVEHGGGARPGAEDLPQVRGRAKMAAICRVGVDLLARMLRAELRPKGRQQPGVGWATPRQADASSGAQKNESDRRRDRRSTAQDQPVVRRHPRMRAATRTGALSGLLCIAVIVEIG